MSKTTLKGWSFVDARFSEEFSQIQMKEGTLIRFAKKHNFVIYGSEKKFMVLDLKHKLIFWAEREKKVKKYKQTTLNYFR